MDAKADSMIENRFFFWEPVFFYCKNSGMHHSYHSQSYNKNILD